MCKPFARDASEGYFSGRTEFHGSGDWRASPEPTTERSHSAWHQTSAPPHKDLGKGTFTWSLLRERGVPLLDARSSAGVAIVVGVWA